jgi:hypothetical protein
MTDKTPEVTTAQESAVPENVASNLDALKAQADLLQITYHPNIGEAALAKKLEEYLAKDAPTQGGVPAKTHASKSEQLRLCRVRITCMNPAKKELEGEIITCGNAKVGTVRKLVQFGVDWHIPQIMLNVMKAKKFPQFYTKKLQGGVTTRLHRMVPEYAIEELPALTEKELKDLAQRQAMANGTASL